MSHHYTFQRNACEVSERPILNIASKEDPAGLGASYGAINLDLLDYDPHTQRDLTTIPNFVKGSALDLPFKDEEFPTCVLGEFLEHCTVEAGTKAVQEAWRVLRPKGKLILTFPLDSRPKDQQHAQQFLVTWDPAGITAWHQTVWEDPMLDNLFSENGFVVEIKTALDYGWAKGWGILLRKNENKNSL